MAEEDECSGFPHSNACVVWAMRTGETLCPEPKSTSSPTVVEGGRVVIEGMGADPEMAFAEALTNYGRDPGTVAMKKAVVNLLRAGVIVGLDPREMVTEALAELERTDG